MTFIVLGFIAFTCAKAGLVQTDTHTYRTYAENNAVLALNRQTGEITEIIVGPKPISITIHGNKGYVICATSTTIPVVDLQTHTITNTIALQESPKFITFYRNIGCILMDVSRRLSIFNPISCLITKTLPIGHCPDSIEFYENWGYIVNEEEHFVSVLDLETHTISVQIETNYHPQSIKIHDEIGYIDHWESSLISVLNLKTNRIITTFQRRYSGTINFSHTHIFSDATIVNNKERPLYPSKDILKTFMLKNQLGDFVALMPGVFNLGEIEHRLYPKEDTLFDTLPVYILMIDFPKFINEPESILNLLMIMKHPQRILKGKPGLINLRYDIYRDLFQALWTNDSRKSQRMIMKLTQLKDPIITPLATYRFKVSSGVKKVT